ncbi:MAG: hypothetical protein QXM38_04515 [Candidatus Aenigmatarchaeota archaeon]
MVSKETKNKVIKMIITASFLFFVGSFFSKYLIDDYLAIPTFLFCLTMFFLAGSFYVSAFLLILDDRKDFIKIVKEDLKHIYKKTKINRKS